MPVYAYTARDSSGKSVRGAQEAANESAAVKILQGQGLIVTQIADSARNAEFGRERRKRRRQRVKSSDLLFFIKQIAALLEAGIPLLRAVELISMQVES